MADRDFIEITPISSYEIVIGSETRTFVEADHWNGLIELRCGRSSWIVAPVGGGITKVMSEVLGSGPQRVKVIIASPDLIAGLNFVGKED